MAAVVRRPRATAATRTAVKAKTDQDLPSIPTFKLSPCHANVSRAPTAPRKPVFTHFAHRAQAHPLTYY